MSTYDPDDYGVPFVANDLITSAWANATSLAAEAALEALDDHVTDTTTHGVTSGAIESTTGAQLKANTAAGLVQTNVDALSSATTTALAGKANTSHTQSISTIIGLQAALDALDVRLDFNDIILGEHEARIRELEEFIGGLPPGLPGEGTLDPTGGMIPPTAYTIPTGAIYYDSATGNDANDGTDVDTPVATIVEAVTQAGPGGTIVVRAGNHHDSYRSKTSQTLTAITVATGLTIQNYPGEQAWFTGAIETKSGYLDATGAAQSWAASGTGVGGIPLYRIRVRAPGFCNFTYDTTDPLGSGWAAGNTHTSQCMQFDNQAPVGIWAPGADPMGCWVNGVWMRPVASTAEVSKVDLIDPNPESAIGIQQGTFFFDWATDGSGGGYLYQPWDPTTVQSIEITQHEQFAVLTPDNTSSDSTYTIRGVGFKRYASNRNTDGTGCGMLYCAGGGGSVAGRIFKFENCVFKEASGNGIHLNNTSRDASDRSLFHRCVFVRNGGSGVNGNGSNAATTSTPKATPCDFTDTLFMWNNRRNFDQDCDTACGTAGIKLNNWKGMTVDNCRFEHNGYNRRVDQGYAMGLWFDQDCEDIEVVNNTFIRNSNSGLMYEASGPCIIAGNLFVDNGENSLRVSGFQARVWHNTFVATSMPSPLASGGTAKQPQHVDIYEDVRSPKSTWATTPQATYQQPVAPPFTYAGDQVRYNSEDNEFCNNLLVSPGSPYMLLLRSHPSQLTDPAANTSWRRLFFHQWYRSSGVNGEGYWMNNNGYLCGANGNKLGSQAKASNDPMSGAGTATVGYSDTAALRADVASGTGNTLPVTVTDGYDSASYENEGDPAAWGSFFVDWVAGNYRVLPASPIFGIGRDLPSDIAALISNGVTDASLLPLGAVNL